MLLQKSECLSATRFVVSIARKTHWHHARLDPLDIVQAGNLGLSRAIQKFDERKGFRFSTYATWWIRQAITRHVADTGRIIRLPVHVHDQIKRMTAAQRALEIDLTRSPTLQSWRLSRDGSRRSSSIAGRH